MYLQFTGTKICKDSNATFKTHQCIDINQKPRLCKKEYITFLCPNWCDEPHPSRLLNCCDDFDGEFKLREDVRKCDFLLLHKKICTRKEWVRHLCPRTCGACNETITPVSEQTEEEEDVFVGVVENNTFATGQGQPLQAKVKLFGPSAIKPYENCDQFKSDLSSVASMIVNGAIADNADFDPERFHYRAFGSSPIQMDDAQPSPSTTVGEDSYDTNVQVEGVDEADVIKSTNETVYAAYGDKLVVWEAKTLKTLSVTVMPSEQEEGRKLSSAYFPNRSQVSIQGLLLYDNRLAVIVSHDQWYYPFESTKDRKILQNYGSVSLRLYDVSDLTGNNNIGIKHLATTKLEGNYVDARLIENTAHIITTAHVDTYYHLTRHFSRYTYQKLYENMTKVEYTAYATSYAKYNVIPSFVQKFMDEVDVGEQCTNFMQLTMFKSSSGAQQQKIREMPVHSIINGMAHVTTFDMLDNYTKEEVNAKSTSILLPSSYNTEVYASTDKLVLATRGQEISNETEWLEKTYFQVISLSKNGTDSIGQVPGYLLNQYSMDLWDGHLRVATTTPAKWGCTSTNETVPVVKSNTIFNRFCNRTMLVDSDNFVHVLRLPTNGSETIMEVVGSLNNLGKAGEHIEAVRFMGDKAFVVTFLRTDPFYTIDLSNHSNPRQVGALEITGYSNYLHPYDEEGNILIGVGQDANEDGVATGLQISLFDATDLTNATLIKRYSVENESGLNDTTVWSSSAAQYDPKAFRFLPESKKLILPTSIRDYKDSTQNFDGFIVFDLASKDISYSFNISHVDPKQLFSYCWYDAYLSSRSLVHDGVVTTTKGHTVLAHDLETKKMVLKPLNLDINNTECAPGGYWIDY